MQRRTRSDTLRRKWSTYVHAAVHRSLTIDITATHAQTLLSRRCTYCGGTGGGIDRLDAAIGYTVDNTVSCCARCNAAKGQLDPRTFLERAAHIAGHATHPEAWDPWGHGTAYSVLKQRALDRGRLMTLTPGQHARLQVRPCHYCHRAPDDDRTHGIDRIDPDRGYTVDNTVPCCTGCNLMKHVQARGAFLRHMDRVARHAYTTRAQYATDIHRRHRGIVRRPLQCLCGRELRRLRRTSSRALICIDCATRTCTGCKVARPLTAYEHPASSTLCLACSQ